MVPTWEITATALNLRAAPQAGAAIVTVMRKGQHCLGTGAPATADGWLPVAFEGRLGHASLAWLRSVPGTATGRPPAAPVVARVSPGPAALPADPSMRLRDLKQLHPHFRQALQVLLASLEQADAPFRVFEAYRTPERQQWLHAQGRSRPGAIVTKAQAWQSMHQYGLAADLVLFTGGQWSWRDDGPLAAHWAQLRTLAAAAGLRTLTWEAPHVEWPVALGEAAGPQLMAAADEDWLDNMAATTARWQLAGGQGAPVLAAIDRPPLPAA